MLTVIWEVYSMLTVMGGKFYAYSDMQGYFYQISSVYSRGDILRYGRYILCFWEVNSMLRDMQGQEGTFEILDLF